MDSIPNKPVIREIAKVDLETHYKSMITEQNKQIYTQYGRIADLLEENVKLTAEVERLTQLNEFK